MNAKTAAYVQAIRGPVLLVTIGVLFAIHQAGVLSFSRTWPLLIIVFGVMKLFERAWSPTPQWSGAPSAAYVNTGRAAYPGNRPPQPPVPNTPPRDYEENQVRNDTGNQGGNHV